ncbi:hypothetical protein ACO9S2_00590 [Nitrospira sp. NS4]|uniref:hypothetical protein n=1 Tax=Nitrospira sp. NS4 TaxID=3414498 RepID=UPI003C2AF4FF
MQETSKNPGDEKVRKKVDPAAPVRDSEDLTCNEGQVEDLLSQGESAEADRPKKPKRPSGK